jgi:hypothetical protein
MATGSFTSEGLDDFDMRAELDAHLAATAGSHAAERELRAQRAALAARNRSENLPSQLVAWHEFNWTGSEDSGQCGEWLRCLKATRAGDRQLIWSGNAIRGVVTFAGWVRDCDGFYEGWGGITHLRRTVTKTELLHDRQARSRFDARGVHALQGPPIRLGAPVANAIVKLAKGLPATDMPTDRPDYSEEPILWAGLHGLAPESYIEAAVAATPRLWRKLGFPSAPERQVGLGDAGRPDLISGDVVGEAKRAVTATNGPDQVERYLDYLHEVEHRPLSRLKGVLLQCAEDTSQAVIDRLDDSEYELELWAVIDDDGHWVLDQLY